MRLIGRYVVSLAAAAAVLAGTAPAFASVGDAPGDGYGPGDAGWVNYYSSPDDTATWKAFCADAGATEVTVPGIAVPACGPTGGTPIDLPYSYPYGNSRVTYTPGFQCVELTDRYMYVTRHWGTVGGDGADVVRVYGAAHKIAPVVGGTPGEAPRPGDVISFSVEPGFTDDNDFYPGHTAIVSAASVGPAGNGSVTILSENFSGTAETTQLGVSNWSLQPIESADADDDLVNTPYIEWLPLARPDAGSGTAAAARQTAIAVRHVAPVSAPSVTSHSAGQPDPASPAGLAAGSDPGAGLLGGLASTASPAITGLSGGAWQVAYPTA
jgi:hypothetical protein